MDRLGVVTVAAQSGISDRELVTACLGGDQDAWSTLIDRYKRLVYSIPVRAGLPGDEAADIFQAVCLDLVTALPSLREPAALPKWLIETTSRRCWRHKRRLARTPTHGEAEDEPAVPAMAARVILELQQAQALRAAVWQLPPRCRALVEMLFFEAPPRPYRDVAARLGVAEGSIGFIRGRCLKRLRASLRSAGL